MGGAVRSNHSGRAKQREGWLGSIGAHGEKRCSAVQCNPEDACGAGDIVLNADRLLVPQAVACNIRCGMGPCEGL